MVAIGGTTKVHAYDAVIQLDQPIYNASAHVAYINENPIRLIFINGHGDTRGDLHCVQLGVNLDRHGAGITAPARIDYGLIVAKARDVHAQDHRIIDVRYGFDLLGGDNSGSGDELIIILGLEAAHIFLFNLVFRHSGFPFRFNILRR